MKSKTKQFKLHTYIRTQARSTKSKCLMLKYWSCVCLTQISCFTVKFNMHGMVNLCFCFCFCCCCLYLCCCSHYIHWLICLASVVHMSIWCSVFHVCTKFVYIYIIYPSSLYTYMHSVHQICHRCMCVAAIYQI